MTSQNAVTVRIGVVLIVLGLLASGCGDEGETAPPTTLAGGESAPAGSATAHVTQTVAPASPADELAAYLKQMEALQEKYKAVRKDGLAAFDIDPDDTTFADPGPALREMRDRLNELAVEMVGVGAPDELAEAHDGLVESLRLFGDWAYVFQKPASELNRQALAELGPRVDKLRAAWRTAVLAYGREINADAPAWVERVGTGG